MAGRSAASCSWGALRRKRVAVKEATRSQSLAGVCGRFALVFAAAALLLLTLFISVSAPAVSGLDSSSLSGARRSDGLQFNDDGPLNVGPGAPPRSVARGLRSVGRFGTAYIGSW